MIQSAHIIAGASLAVVSGNPWLVLPGALASHYLLDIIPHKEYAIDKMHKMAETGEFGWDMVLAIAKGAVDVTLGYLAVILLTNGDTLAILAGVVATIPDVFHVVDVSFAKWKGLPYPAFHENPYNAFKKGVVMHFLAFQRHLHYKIHLLERNAVPRWIGFITQSSAIFASVSVLFVFGLPA